jgi:hypothetical protein
MMELHEVTWAARRSAILLLVLVLTGCGAWPLGKPSASPSPLPGDRMVFLLQGGAGGFTPHFHQALLTPALAVYGDGRVIQYDEGEQDPNVPAAYVLSRVDPALVATFVADAEARNLINSETDFGYPAVTDTPSTTVLLHGASGPHRISVYAFDAGFDDDLTRAQRRARQELAEVIDRASALPGDGERLPYLPDRVKVTEFAFDGGGKGRAKEWPGPDPESFLVPSTTRSIRLACGELSGPAAEKVYAAARDDPDGVWTHDSKQRVFAVAPMLPGTEGCPT